MSDFVEYSRSLMEAAKGFRAVATEMTEGEIKQAYLRASFLHACSFLEAHLNYMAEHFTNDVMFSIHEKGILLEREVRFEKGKFRLASTLKIARITDRIDLLIAKCSSDPVAEKAGWYSDINTTLTVRNSLVHPKSTHIIKDAEVSLALTSILKAVDTLYSVVFKKNLPYAKRGIDGGLNLIIEKHGSGY